MTNIAVLTEKGCFFMDAIELWRESIPEESRIEVGTAAALVGAGLVAAVASVAQRRRGFFAWAIPGALLSAGLVVLAGAMLSTRNDRILEAQTSIEEQLAALDPVARAQVLANVGQSQFKAMLPHRV